jgi:hypothetical protein
VTGSAASGFPELRRVFSGYLHEDFLAESGSAEAALGRFWEDADPDERRRFQREVARFLARAAALDADATQELLSQLGCRWRPPSLEALTGLLTVAAHLSNPPSKSG